MKPLCAVYNLGYRPYQEVWELQKKLAGEIAAGTHPDTLLLVEHPPIYTFGRRGQVQNLLWDQGECARRGIEVLWVDRGGDVTYHGPGQLVAYPLLQLAPLAAVSVQNDSPNLPPADYIGYLRQLEQILIQTLAYLGVPAYLIDGLTGVWVTLPGNNPAKIAAIGVKVDAKGITRHGFALNLATDPVYWQGIIACGLADHAVTDLAALLNPLPEPAEVRRAVITAFGQVFGFEMQLLELAKPSFEN